MTTLQGLTEKIDVRKVAGITIASLIGIGAFIATTKWVQGLIKELERLTDLFDRQVKCEEVITWAIFVELKTIGSHARMIGYTEVHYTLVEVGFDSETDKFDGHEGIQYTIHDKDGNTMVVYQVRKTMDEFNNIEMTIALCADQAGLKMTIAPFTI